MAAPAGLIDPTKTGNYPVILGDGLLGKTPNEIFTGIRYNHKPTLSSSAAPNAARLKPSSPGKTTSYDLSYTDNDNKYAFTGTRDTSDNQYVLYFDPERRAFVLDKVDSTFNMNATRLPNNSDPDSLRRQHPHIDITASQSKAAASSAQHATEPAKPAPKPAPKPRAKPAAQKKDPPPKKEVKKKQSAKPISLSLPQPEPPKPAEKKRQAPQPDDEDEDEDDDGGLLVEYPGADPRNNRHTDFSPAFPAVRRFDDFMNQRESEGDDADGEDDDEPDLDFKLPSPVNNHRTQPEPEPEPESQLMEEDDAGGDLEDDLAKEMEIAFGDLENSNGASNDGEESEISEED